MTNDKNSYFNRAHRLGRIGTIIAILFMIGIPVVVCFIYDVMPTFSEVFTTAIGLLAVYVPTALSEDNQLHSHAGYSCYITFITGNVGNMKIPCALNAMEMTDSPLGTEAGRYRFRHCRQRFVHGDHDRYRHRRCAAGSACSPSWKTPPFRLPPAICCRLCSEAW